MDLATRRETIALELEAYSERGDLRRWDVEFRGEMKPLEVVRVPVDLPLLNHDNSRVRAQITTHPDRDDILRDPESSKSQGVLTELLRNSGEFKELCQQLKDLTQVEPGVITRDGMLVDGNTRLVALRDLGVSSIDVAVLPLNATAADYLDVELSIQLRKLITRDYSFTNRLLLVRSLADRFDSRDAIFKAMGWQRDGEKRLQAHLRWLDLVEEIREHTNKPYSFFDDKYELLKNLDDSYQSLLREDPPAAEELKWTRIFSLVLGLNKDEIRALSEEFVADHVSAHLPGSDAEEFFRDIQIVSSPDSALQELLGEDLATSQRFDMKRATQKIIDLDEDSEVRGTIFRGFKTGARAIIERKVKEEIRTQPLEYLDEIADKVQELVENLPIYFDDEKFDKGKFSFRSKKIVKAMKDLEQLLSRYM
jgi:hypothetical protein